MPMNIKLTLLLSLQALQSELQSLEDGLLRSDSSIFLLEFLTGKLKRLPSVLQVRYQH
jgi:hypothetical protein